MILAQWARILGAAKVLLTDVDGEKLRMAKELGLGITFDARKGDPVAWAERVTGGRRPDLVVEAAGVSATFEQAIRMARPLGRVVIMGNPTGEVRLPQGTVSQILRKELTIKGTWNSCFTELPVDEWQVVVEMLAKGRLNLRGLISHRLPLSKGVEVLEMMRSRREAYNRVVLINEGAEEGERQ
jgi:L-iditol 2-dehydrogenase